MEAELNTDREAVKTTLLLMWDKAKDFIQRAFTIIFLATIIIWFLQSFDMTTVKRELGSLKGTFFVILYQTGFAWLAAFCVYRIGRLFIA